MRYNGEGKVNAEQMFEVEDKPGVVPQKQVKCWDVQLRCPIHPKSYKHVLKRLFPSYKLRTWIKLLANVVQITEHVEVHLNPE